MIGSEMLRTLRNKPSDVELVIVKKVTPDEFISENIGSVYYDETNNQLHIVGAALHKKIEKEKEAKDDN